MFNKILPKIIFLALVVALAFAGGLLYRKTASTLPAIQAINAPQTITTNIMTNDAITTQPSNTKPVPAKATCIITIDGQKYDVQPLRDNHSGGDIFVCGTDMSDVFHGQHGNNLKMIQKYLIK